jgi:iron complex transport system substrate-binding protein
MAGEFIATIGAWDRVVGRDTGMIAEPYLPGLEDIPGVNTISQFYDLNWEKVFELNPDVFITTSNWGDPSLEVLIERLEPEIPVVLIDSSNPQNSIETMNLLGKLFGEEERAKEFADFWNKYDTLISNRLEGIAEEQKKRVFYAMSMDGFENVGTMSNQLPAIKAMFDASGSENIAGDLEQYFILQVEPEWLIESDPEIILCGLGDPSILGFHVDDTAPAQAIIDKLNGLSYIAGTTAAENRDIYLLEGSGFAGGPRFIAAQACMVKWFYPELFADLDPQAIHQEFIDRFLNIDFDLDEHGVFVYPEP